MFVKLAIQPEKPEQPEQMLKDTSQKNYMNLKLVKNIFDE
jgi:hypothetical protein